MKNRIAIAAAIVALGLTSAAQAQVSYRANQTYAQPTYTAPSWLDELFGNDTVRTGRSVAVAPQPQEPDNQYTRSFYDRKAPF